MWRSPRLPLVFWLVRTLVHIVTFLLAGVVFNMAQVLGLVLIFFRYFSGIDLSGWTFLSFSLTLLGIGGLNLRLISKRRRIMRLSLFFILVRSLVMLLLMNVILILLDQRLIYFWALGIDFPSSGGWLEAGFCFCINNLLYHLVPHIQVLPLIVQLSSNR